MFSLFYWIKKTIRNYNVSFFVIVSVILFYIVESSGGLYPQGIPHRHVSLGVVLLAILLTDKVKKITRCVIFYFLGVIFIIWNTDMGIVYALSLLIYLFFSFKESVVEIFISVLSLAIGEFFASYFITSCLNIVVLGGRWMSIKTFVYPLLQVDILPLQPSYSNIIWILCLMFYCFILGNELYYKVMGLQSNSILAMFSAMGIMLFVYFYNRAAWTNLIMSEFIVAILVAAIKFDEAYEKELVNNYSKCSYIVGLLSILFLCGIIYILPTGLRCAQTYWDMNNTYNYLTNFEKSLPVDDCYMFGSTSAYHQILSPKIKSIQWDDVNHSPSSWIELEDFIMNHNHSFVVQETELSDAICYWTSVDREGLAEFYDSSHISVDYIDANGEKHIFNYMLFEPK
ncbi:hypothetical protein [Pseudobutyrivibrio sp. JW11]|uniref:hypothetical protein n=1 Tax=Pseudobutyrivibrio sp. JW11 TaxID=1855302 RepID=UPI00116017F5|nr:hypothetical protein [Pseudobutyrivibrio sp. JW11]